MTDHAWRELAGAYALGALGPEDTAEFEAHLAGCAACRADVQAFREVAGFIAGAVPPATPDPALRERVMREARRVRPLRRTPLVPWLAAAAALVLALGLGAAYQRQRRDLAAAQDSLARQEQLIAVVLSPDAQTVALASKGQPPSVRLFWNPQQRRIVISARNLPPASAGRTYQLWAIAQGKAPVSVGIFNTAPDGRLITSLDVPAGLVFQVTAVTEEPAGGSPQPTQTPFLVGELPRTE